MLSAQPQTQHRQCICLQVPQVFHCGKTENLRCRRSPWRSRSGSAGYKGLCLYVARVLQPAWEEPVVAPVSRGSSQLRANIPSATLQVQPLCGYFFWAALGGLCEAVCRHTQKGLPVMSGH